MFHPRVAEDDTPVLCFPLVYCPLSPNRSPAPAAAAAQDEWQSDRPASSGEDRRGGGYEGPAGMDPEGLIDSNWDEICENFDDMELREELLRGIYAYGFEKPSAIQQRAIVPCVRGMDVIAQVSRVNSA